MEERRVENELVDRYYRVKRLLARGGMSEILDAEHVLTGRRVALKILHADRLNHAEYRGRLEREARLMERARGPGVVELLGAGECAKFGPYLAMEYLVGRPLDGILVARGRLSLEEARGVFVPLAQTMARLHDKRIVHRDLKPANIFVSFTGGSERTIKVLDFGVSTWLDPRQGAAAPKLTTKGELLGTLEYMAPEQLMAVHEQIDARSDIFGFGVSLYEVLTGKLPLGADGPERVEALRLRSEAPSLLGIVPGVTPEFASLVSEMMSFDRGRRPASLADTLEVLSGQSAQRVPTAPLVAGAVPAPKGAEQRRTARAAYVSAVRVLAGERVLDGRSEDLSEGGMLLMAKATLPAGERVQVRFALPMDGRIVQVAGIVRWCREGHGRVALGLEWIEPSDELNEAVRAYLRLMQDPARAG